MSLVSKVVYSACGVKFASLSPFLSLYTIIQLDNEEHKSEGKRENYRRDKIRAALSWL